MDKNSLNELRAQVRKLHRSATAKVSRNERKGIKLRGSKYDPRRDPKTIGRLNRKQLEAQAARLSEFTSRSTQFVPDRKNRPLPAKEWREFERRKNAVNKKSMKAFQKVGHVKLPVGDETIIDRLERMTPKHKRMGNRTVNVPYAPLDTKPKNIESEKGLAKLIARMDKRLGESYIRDEVKLARRSASKILGRLGEKELRRDVNKLTDAQFYTLWNMSTFAVDITIPYEDYKKDLEGQNKPKYHSAAMEDSSLREAKRLVGWAKSNVSEDIRF